jgi:hypothetical protein
MKKASARSCFEILLALLVIVAATGCGTVRAEEATVQNFQSQHAGAIFRIDDARSFKRFPLYWLGSSFGSLPLSALTRRADAPAVAERVRADYVGFIYGDCVALDEKGCAPPLEIQIWPACVRSLADYMLTPSGQPLPHRRTIMRGVPAAYFEHGLRLELYTGKVTIVIFGLRRRDVERAAFSLRGANPTAANAATLPPPAPGAMAGKLPCA